jgi:hypothetical protein
VIRLRGVDPVGCRGERRFTRPRRLNVLLGRARLPSNPCTRGVPRRPGTRVVRRPGTRDALVPGRRIWSRVGPRVRCGVLKLPDFYELLRESAVQRQTVEDFLVDHNFGERRVVHFLVL